MSETRDDGGAAFPRNRHSYEDRWGSQIVDRAQEGMSLRDYFAAKAMAGIVGSIDNEEGYVRLAELAQGAGLDTVSQWIARESYKQADAMLKARDE